MDSIFISVCLMYERYFCAKYFWKNKEVFSVILSKTIGYNNYIDLIVSSCSLECICILRRGAVNVAKKRRCLENAICSIKNMVCCSPDCFSSPENGFAYISWGLYLDK